MSTLLMETEKALGSAADQAMQTLNARWYNTMTAGLNLSSQTFQIYQSNVLLGNMSNDLWAIFDTIPPLSVTHQAEPSQINRFSDDYGGVINTVLPAGAAQWKITMGDSYADWVAYLADYRKSKPQPPIDMMVLFRDWAQLNLPDPATAQRAITQYSQILHGVIATAQSRFIGAGEVYAYNKSIADLRAQVKQAPSGKYTFNSATASSDLSHTWAQSSSGGGFGFLWGGGGSSSRDSINNKFSTANVLIDVSFSHVLALPAGPLMTSTFIGDKTYPGWFSSEAFAYAYQNKGNDVWPVDGAATWESTFGKNGNLKRFATSIVVADEITMTMTSAATYSSDEREAIRSESGGGFWPFYNTRSSSGSDTSVTFNDQGNMTVTVKSPAGSPLILGVNVLPIEQIFG